MTSLGECVDKKDSWVCIYVDLEERQERKGRKDPRWMMNQESWEGKVKGHKDPRWKEDVKPLVLVAEVQGWIWKMQKDNKEVHQHLYENKGHQHLQSDYQDFQQDRDHLEQEKLI